MYWPCDAGASASVYLCMVHALACPLLLLLLLICTCNPHAVRGCAVVYLIHNPYVGSQGRAGFHTSTIHWHVFKVLNFSHFALSLLLD